MRALLDSPVVRHHARPAGPPLPAVPVALAAAAVLTQVAYPLLDGTALRAATMLGVVLFAAASVGHAAAAYGARAAVAVVVGRRRAPASLAEAVGVATGVPFGRYAYSGTLGPQVLGVPLLVPLAWTMMAYPALLLGRRLAGLGRRPAARRTLGRRPRRRHPRRLGPLPRPADGRGRPLGVDPPRPWPARRSGRPADEPRRAGCSSVW